MKFCLVAASIHLFPLIAGLTLPLAAPAATNYVGIGTTVPLVRLDVSGAGINDSALMVEDTSAAANVKRLRIRSNGGFAYFDAPNDAFTGVTTQPMTFNLTTGNVGIGTTNPCNCARVIVRQYTLILPAASVSEQHPPGPNWK